MKIPSILRPRGFARRMNRHLSRHHSAGEEIRLHLGCGREYWQGYVNIDADPKADCDICMDFTRVHDFYPDNSVSEVVMIHSLSYLRLWEARDLMKDIYQLLIDSGRFIIEVPDLAKCARRALDSEGQIDEYIEAVRGLYAFDMNQIRHKKRFSTYAFGWSGWHLKHEMEVVGFRQISICEPKTHGLRLWRDTRIEALK